MLENGFLHRSLSEGDKGHWHPYAHSQGRYQHFCLLARTVLKAQEQFQRCNALILSECLFLGPQRQGGWMCLGKRARGVVLVELEDVRKVSEGTTCVFGKHNCLFRSRKESFRI